MVIWVCAPSGRFPRDGYKNPERPCVRGLVPSWYYKDWWDDEGPNRLILDTNVTILSGVLNGPGCGE